MKFCLLCEKPIKGERDFCNRCRIKIDVRMALPPGTANRAYRRAEEKQRWLQRHKHHKVEPISPDSTAA